METTMLREGLELRVRGSGLGVWETERSASGSLGRGFWGEDMKNSGGTHRTSGPYAQGLGCRVIRVGFGAEGSSFAGLGPRVRTNFSKPEGPSAQH